MKILKTVVLLIALSFTGCIHKASGPVTPMERISTDWAVLGEFLTTAEQGTEAVETSGLATAVQISPVIKFELSSAQTHQSLTPVIAQGAQGITGSTALTQFLQSLITGAQNVVTVDVKNPKTQEAVSADIKEVGILAQAILNDISALRGGQ